MLTSKQWTFEITKKCQPWCDNVKHTCIMCRPGA